MKKVLGLFCLLLTTQLLSAQLLEWGEASPGGWTKFGQQVISNNGEGSIVLFTTGGKKKLEYGVTRFNKALEIEEEVMLTLDANDEKAFFEACADLDDQRFVIFTSNDDSEKLTVEVYANIFNKESLDQEPERILVAALKHKNDKRWYPKELDIKQSADKSAWLIYSDLPESEKGTVRLSLTVVNKDFQQVWNTSHDFGKSTDFFWAKECLLTNDGDVYVTGRVYEDKARFGYWSADEPFEHLIAKFSGSGAEIEELPVAFKGKEVRNLMLEESPIGEILAIGFYARVSPKSKRFVEGAVYFKIDMEPSSLKAAAFSKFKRDFTFMGEVAGKNKAYLDDIADYHFEVADFVYGESGEVTYIAEPVSNNSTWTNYDFEHGDLLYSAADIFVVNFKNSGEIKWATKIPKPQANELEQRHRNSYALMVEKNSLHFVYHEGKRASKDDFSRQAHFESRPQSNLVAVEVNRKTGERTKKPLFTYGEKVVKYVYPELFLQSDDSIYLITMEIKAYGIGRISMF